jgi:hypothetical protein
VQLGHAPRTGPDGRLRYGWDERLRLGKGRLFEVHHHSGAGLEGHPTCTRGRFEGWGRNGSTVKLRVEADAVVVPAHAVWDVRPAAEEAPLVPIPSGSGRR